MSAAAKPAPIRRDWIAKSLAGVVLGLALAFGASGLFALAAAGLAPGARAQLAMWLVVPVWFGVLGGVFLFASGLRAWLWLAAANLLVWGALAAARLF